MDFYATEEDDEPFKVNEQRFWSIRTIPKFLLFGIPRIVFMIVFYIIIFIITLSFNKDNINFQNKFIGYCARLKLEFFGFKDIDIDEKSFEIIKNSKAQIIICNHSSYIDSLLLLYLIPEAKIIASDFVGKIPIINNLFKHKCLYLTSDFKGNMTDLIAKEIEMGNRIIIFSEGVCCRSDLLIKLRNGAFVPKKNILPIFIDYPDKNYWVMGENDMVMHAMCLLANRRNRILLRACPEYVVEEKDNDVEQFNENFRKYYAQEFNIKLSKKSYKDHPFYKQKIKNIPEKK